MFTIEYSSMCLNSGNYLKKIEQARDIVSKNGFTFGIQLHNSIDKELFNNLLKLKDSIPFSAHSPLFTEYFLNLAEDGFDNIEKTARENIKYLKLINSKIFFFHGFFMTNKPIPNKVKSYNKIMKESMLEKYQLNHSVIMNPSYLDTDEFVHYKENFKIHYKMLADLYPEYTLALENDYTGVGCGLQRPKELLELVDNLWLDAGHLWCSSLLHKFDYYEAIDTLLAKKNVIGIHLNRNITPSNAKKEDIRDPHAHFYLKGEPREQNLELIIKKVLSKKIPKITLEIIDGDIEDLKMLLNWINS